MDKEKRKNLIWYGGLVAVAALVGLWWLWSHRGVGEPVQGGGKSAISVSGGSGGSSAEKVGVHVAGAVVKPGVYVLPGGSRVSDAIMKAGGPLPRADMSSLNLAAKLEDGRQVLVAEKVAPGSGGVEGGGSGGGDSGGATTANGKRQINLNRATQAELEELDGVGPSTARKILQYREEHGSFSSVDELGEVSGIGEKRLASLRDQVTV